jgi:hypothetical protein
MKRGFVIILLVLSACIQTEIYPGQAVQKPLPVYPPSQEPIVVPVVERPTVIPSLQPTPTPNKECRKQCDSALQSCRAKSQPQFSVCVDNARTAMKDCLRTGDDAYCRLEYSKVRTVCFNSLMAGCDILFNTCVSNC